ncbi:chromate transporter [Treponema phagedenis]|uniref:Chromate transport protein n=1 Tax=Treponema phagedenis TaxID=162 RepID=A0A0B7GYI3_TREPH|nr:chromate transporter [Treponema phagedenis]EFW37590.1 chromate transport protein [Treponema phagedenis F0421]NVP24875.1 chromate transporter [Treponema phagedenis]QEJ96017.1 chromate transporter [Treponema phagedenis]QEJ98977.1 chromate transporter [Treponema phagedenis]QEK01783.1 chromate transporter [Treponema phagedenis]
MSLPALFFLFFYIGFCTIGGGLVSISIMQQELVSRGLISPENFYAMVAISESTPGPIGINMTTYIGYELYGVVGDLVVTTGIVLPSLITIVLIAKYSSNFQDTPIVKKTFYGLRAGATGMIAVAAWNVLNVALLTVPRFLSTKKILDIGNWKAIGFFTLLFVLSTIFKKIHPIVFVVAGAILGVLFF